MVVLAAVVAALVPATIVIATIVLVPLPTLAPVAVPRGRLHREACTHRGTGRGGVGDLGARAVRAKRIAARTPAQRAYFNRSSNGLYYRCKVRVHLYTQWPAENMQTCFGLFTDELL